MYDTEYMAKLPISFRLEENIISAIDEVAILEQRDRTSLIEVAISQFMRQKYPAIWRKAYPELASRLDAFEATIKPKSLPEAIGEKIFDSLTDPSKQ